MPIILDEKSSKIYGTEQIVTKRERDIGWLHKGKKR